MFIIVQKQKWSARQERCITSEVRPHVYPTIEEAKAAARERSRILGGTWVVMQACYRVDTLVEVKEEQLAEVLSNI